MGRKLFTKRSDAWIYKLFFWGVSVIGANKGKHLTEARGLARFTYIYFDGISQSLGKIHIILVVCCFALISTKALVSIAMAESVYKSIMPDGSVIYGERPQQGARSVKKATVNISDTGIKPASKTEIDSINQRALKRSQLLDKTLKTVQTAEDDLRKAEIDREVGVEPLPGERLGIVGRGTRLSEAYWRRQQILEERVDTARKLLKKARQEYNEVR